MIEPMPIEAKKTVWGLNIPTYCLILHFSQLTHFVLPGAGLVIPIVMWAVNKDEDPRIDQHGRIVLNWIASACIYAFIFCILILLVIGIPLLILLGLASTIFSIVGGLKAYKNQSWAYPLSIRILKVETNPSLVNIPSA